MQNQKKKKSLTYSFLKWNQGLTILEILIALTIIGLAATFITGRVMEFLYEGQYKAAKIQMQNLAARLNEYRRNCGSYPTTDQGLDALVKKPTTGKECKHYLPGGYISEGVVPQDPWDNDYDYVSSDGRTYTLKSFGEGGEPGGDGHAKDIYLVDPKDKQNN